MIKELIFHLDNDWDIFKVLYKTQDMSEYSQWRYMVLPCLTQFFSAYENSVHY